MTNSTGPPKKGFNLGFNQIMNSLAVAAVVTGAGFYIRTSNQLTLMQYQNETNAEIISESSRQTIRLTTQIESLEKRIDRLERKLDK